MVPVIVSGAWHDEQIDELFGSLLGKMLGVQVEQNENHAGESKAAPEVGPNDILQGGFRVFG